MMQTFSLAATSVQRIRGYFYNEMRYINLRFTYLLTYLLTYKSTVYSSPIIFGLFLESCSFIPFTAAMTKEQDIIRQHE